jgi:hypothetical protein
MVRMILETGKREKLKNHIKEKIEGLNGLAKFPGKRPQGEGGGYKMAHLRKGDYISAFTL